MSTDKTLKKELRAADKKVEDAREAFSVAARERAELYREAVSTRSIRKVAALAGKSPSRIGQIVKAARRAK